MADAGRCVIVAPGQGRLIDLGDFEMRVKADAGSTRGVVSVLEATEPPGFGPPVHVHDDAAEAFYVLDGEYVMSLAPANSAVAIVAARIETPRDSARLSIPPVATTPPCDDPLHGHRGVYRSGRQTR